MVSEQIPTPQMLNFKMESKDFNYNDILGLTDQMLEDMTIEELEVTKESIFKHNRSYTKDYNTSNPEEMFHKKEGDESDPYYYIPEEKYREIYSIFRKVNNLFHAKIKAKHEKEGDELLPVFHKFLEVDKSRNPKVYPDWLILNVKEKTDYGHIVIHPIIKFDLFLKEGGTFQNVKNVKSRLNTMWRRYVQGGRSLNVSKVQWDGLDEYIKKVFRKTIIPELKKLPGGECIHSVVFRARKSFSDIDIQIYPRIKSECKSWLRQPDDFSEYGLEREIKSKLKEFGWFEYRNYHYDSSRD